MPKLPFEDQLLLRTCEIKYYTEFYWFSLDFSKLLHSPSVIQGKFRIFNNFNGGWIPFQENIETKINIQYTMKNKHG